MRYPLDITRRGGFKTRPYRTNMAYLLRKPDEGEKAITIARLYAGISVARQVFGPRGPAAGPRAQES
jgi:hypothetical protein